MGNVTKQVTFDLTAEDIAQAIWNLGDEQGADVFIHLARIAKEANKKDRLIHPQRAWMAIGSHLATCSCGTDEAREIICDILYGLLNPFANDISEARRANPAWSPPYICVPQREQA